MIRASKPSTGELSYRSRALPIGAVLGWPLISGMSTRTMSPSSLLAAQWAAVAPTFPAPTMVIFARRMVSPSPVAADSGCPNRGKNPASGIAPGDRSLGGGSDYRERQGSFNPRHDDAARSPGQ